MDFSVALSGEVPPAEILEDFSGGIGLIRGEYILRDCEKYLNQPEALDAITEYLITISRLVYPKNVWYRTSDLESGEVAVLVGGQDCRIDPVPSMGLRGVRRSLEYLPDFALELEAFKKARWESPNLNIIFPFISEVHEAEKAIIFSREIIGECRFGAMVETPAASMIIPELVGLGYSHLLFGCNDMWSLVMAHPRIAGNFPHMTLPLSRTLKYVRQEAYRHNITLALAGYCDEMLIHMAQEAGVDNLVIHYSQLPRLCGEKYSGLPDLHKLKEIKTKSRNAQKI